jgi:hypothetical protein
MSSVWDQHLLLNAAAMPTSYSVSNLKSASAKYLFQLAIGQHAPQHVIVL